MKKEFETEDIKLLYTAFIDLCDYIEEEVGCGKCPRYQEFCADQVTKAGNLERHLRGSGKQREIRTRKHT